VSYSWLIEQDFNDDHVAAAARAGWDCVFDIVCLVLGVGRIVIVDLSADQLSAQNEFGCPMTVCEQSVMSNAMEPFWQSMEQEATHEL